MSEYLESLDLYLPAFTEEMEERFKEKAIKYGDTWKNRPVFADGEWQHQTLRILNWLHEKVDIWAHGGEEVNWIDVANEALICWVRENELGEELPIDK